MPDLPPQPEVPAPEPARLDAARLAGLYVAHADELRRFLRGMLRNAEQADDALQNAFAKAAELAHTARDESLKGWLFRVAVNEALQIRRRQRLHQKAVELQAGALSRETYSHADKGSPTEAPDARLVRLEMIDSLEKALAELPAAQRQVVAKRIHEGKTFAQIAQELDIPLGTALTRMQAALSKLRQKLQDPE